MGTSSNHPSPNTPNWNITRSVLGNTDVSEELQSREIWRAAIADRGESLKNDLGLPLLSTACEIAAQATSASEALSKFEQAILNAHAANLTLDLGKRALARAVAVKSGANGFAAELFAETVAYYASRDLPSFIGTPGRVKTTTEAIAIKDKLKNLARKVAHSVSVRTDPTGWKQYVAGVLAALQKESKE